MKLQDLSERCHFQSGDHACVFYRDDDELLQVVGPYLLGGLRSNQRCFTAQRESFIPMLIDFLERNDIDVMQAEKNGQLEIHPADSVYVPNGVFDRVDMCANVRREIEKTVEDGFKGLRMSGDLVWLDDPRTVKEIIDYEYLVNHVTEGLPVVCMCQYPVQRMSSALHDALMQHHNIRIRRLPNNSHYGYSLCDGEHIVEISADGDSASLDLTLQKLGEQEAISHGSALSFNEALASARRSLLSIVSD